jgi:hypothetical protein
MSNTNNPPKNLGDMIWDTLVMLLEDQTGKKYEYCDPEELKEETA